MIAPRRFTRLALPLLALPLALLLGCATPVATQVAGDSAAEPGSPSAAQDEEDEDESAEDSARKIAKKRHELAMAHLQRELDQLGNEEKLRAAHHRLRQAEQAVAEAESALAHFQQNEAPLARRREQLDVDGATGRRDDSQAELEELEAMYSEEEFAQSTKELVLRRGRRSLEHSNRRLAMATEELRHLVEVEQPKRVRELTQALEGKRSDLTAAGVAGQRAQLELAMGTQKTSFSIENLERELAELTDDESGS